MSLQLDVCHLYGLPESYTLARPSGSHFDLHKLGAVLGTNVPKNRGLSLAWLGGELRLSRNTF